MKLIAYLTFLVLFYSIDSAAYVDVSIFDKPNNKMEVVVEYCGRMFSQIVSRDEDPDKIKCSILKNMKAYYNTGLLKCNVSECRK